MGRKNKWGLLFLAPAIILATSLSEINAKAEENNLSSNEITAQSESSVVVVEDSSAANLSNSSETEMTTSREETTSSSTEPSVATEIIEPAVEDKPSIDAAGELTLDGVPNFNFVKSDGTQLIVQDFLNDNLTLVNSLTPVSASQTAFDGNDNGTLLITDERGSGSWRLSVRLTPLIDITTNNQIDGVLHLTVGENPVVDVATTQSADVTVYQMEAGGSLSTSTANSTFEVTPSQQVAAGTYQGQVTWTLSNSIQ
ncbi:WxL domain-containing protein [Enterococcus sp. LJL90]